VVLRNSKKKGCRIMGHTVDSKTLGDIFQEIIVKFSEMQPTNLYKLESETLDAIYRIGKGLMQWKFHEWDTELHSQTCSECGSKLENQHRSAHLSTWVADIHYDRYMSKCTSCGTVECPLDEALGLQPRQQSGSSVDELAALSGPSWTYQESEYIIQEALRGRYACHGTLLNKATQVNKAESQELEGVRKPQEESSSQQ
jgi:hypothetical protein